MQDGKISDDDFKRQAKQLIDQSPFSQAWVADQMGTTSVYLCQVLGGQRPLTADFRARLEVPLKRVAEFVVSSPKD